MWGGLSHISASAGVAPGYSYRGDLDWKLRNFFSEKMVSHGNKLLRAVVESLWLEVLKICMDVVLGDMV